MGKLKTTTALRVPAPRFTIKTHMQLRRYIAEACPQMGLNAPEIWKAIRDRTPAGRFILALLAVPEDVLVRHRSQDLEQAARRERAVKIHLSEGRTKAEAIAAVAKEQKVKENTIRASLRRHPHAEAMLYFEPPRPPEPSSLWEIRPLSEND